MFNRPERPKIIWFGCPPQELVFPEAKKRDLVIDVVSTGAVPDWRHARAAVFWAPGQLEDVLAALDHHLVQALDHGLFLHIVAGHDGQRKELERLLSRMLPGDMHEVPRIRTMPGVEPHEGPNKALIHDPGPAPNSALEITGTVDQLTAGHRLLLQRAFHDCWSIKLQLISGGLSGALTYLVDARLSDSNAGPRPMPFFVKLDGPAKLRQEMRRFQRYAEHHIPWFLRPNFVDARCIYGVQLAILVGTFVPSSKSLWEALQEPNGRRHIRALFEETLAGLRQAVPGHAHVVAQGSVVAALEEFCRHERIGATRVTSAGQWGSVHPVRSLWHKLLDLSSQPWQHGTMHGDMHGENVRVRKDDAIVIDFAHAALGPLSADLASLEVWLAFKVPPNGSSDREAWRAQVEYLYRPELIDAVFQGPAADPMTGWVGECIGEIRQLARTSAFSPDEYKRVLAVYLLRQSSFEADCDEVEYRRAYAYWLADRLVLSISQPASADLEVA
jgi:hypothetical protein